MAGIEAKDILEIVQQIESFRKMIEKAGGEGSNKLKGIKLDEVLKKVPRTDEGIFDDASWSTLKSEEQQALYDQLTFVRDALHTATELDGPTDPKHIMSAKYASNTSIVLLTLTGFLFTALLLIAIVFLWDRATATAPVQKDQETPAKQSEGANVKAKPEKDSVDEKPKEPEKKPVEPISESIVLTMVILLGALGGSLHLVSSLVKFIGNRQLKRSWLPYYLAMPFTGAGLAPVVYMLLRVGLITPSGTSTTGGAGFANLNLMAIYAFAVMTGLFSRVALDKLGEVFGTIFRTQTAPSKDALGAQKPPGGTATAGGKSS